MGGGGPGGGILARGVGRGGKEGGFSPAQRKGKGGGGGGGGGGGRGGGGPGVWVPKGKKKGGKKPGPLFFEGGGRGA